MFVVFSKRKVMLDVIKVHLIQNRAIRFIGRDDVEEIVAARHIKNIPGVIDGDVHGYFDAIADEAIKNGGVVKLPV